MSKNFIVPVPLATFNSTGLSGTYQLAATLASPVLILRIVNNSGVAVTVSYDGTNDHDVIQTLATLQLNIQANAGATNFSAWLRQGTQIYVKGPSASTGLIYIAGYSQNAS